MKERIQEIVNLYTQQRPDLFVTELQVSPQNDVQIVLDGDQGVSIQDLTQLTRLIEKNIDREETDYALNISSFGISNPLLNPRQYKKNIGRKAKIFTQEKEYQATITDADLESVTIHWKERVPKEKGKGKINQDFQQKLNYNDIQKTIILITF